MSTTINKEEIQKFSKLADQWWDANGKFKPLHTFNPIRIKYIIDKCSSHFKLNKQKNNKAKNKIKIMDELANTLYYRGRTFKCKNYKY